MEVKIKFNLDVVFLQGSAYTGLTVRLMATVIYLFYILGEKGNI